MAGLLRKIVGALKPAPKLLEPGTPAPDFRVQAHDGRTLSLGDFRGSRVILWFYPKADTPGCTVEGKGLCAEYDKFESRGVRILGVSFDSVAENRAFAEKFGFQYPLLCDTKREIGLAYGACDSADAKNARRISYVIDEKGIIRHVLPKVDPQTHTREMLELLK